MSEEAERFSVSSGTSSRSGGPLFHSHPFSPLPPHGSDLNPPPFHPPPPFTNSNLNPLPFHHPFLLHRLTSTHFHSTHPLHHGSNLNPPPIPSLPPPSQGSYLNPPFSQTLTLIHFHHPSPTPLTTGSSLNPLPFHHPPTSLLPPPPPPSPTQGSDSGRRSSGD